MSVFKTRSLTAEMRKADGKNYQEFDQYRFSGVTFTVKDRIGNPKPIPSKRRKT